MGSIGSSMSPSARMTAASGIARQLATWPSCARSPSTSWGGTEHPGSACGRVASRPPGTMITCSLFWLADFMRRPWDRPERALAYRETQHLACAASPIMGGRHAQHILRLLVEASVRAVTRVVDRLRHAFALIQRRAHALRTMRVRIGARREPGLRLEQTVEIA